MKVSDTMAIDDPLDDVKVVPRPTQNRLNGRKLPTPETTEKT